MKHLGVYLPVALLSLSVTITALAEEAPLTQAPAPQAIAPSKSICETMNGFNDWDFWLGEWKVVSNDGKRTYQGSNRITKHHKNCLIMENWSGAQGGEGSSMNYYDPVEHHWRQLWVAGGYSIDYTGGLDKTGAMVLTGKINYYKANSSFPFRGTWTANKDGSVRQLFEQFDEDKQVWNIWFDGLYLKN